MILSAVILFATGVVSCVLGSLVGLGGGFIMVPILIDLYHLPPRYIVGTVLVAMIFNSIGSVWGYGRQKRIDYRSGALFAVAGIPGSILGAYVAKSMTGSLFFTLFGVLMLLVSASLFFRPSRPIKLPFPDTVFQEFTDHQGQTFRYSYNGWFAGTVAVGVGFLSSLLGIGGGSIMVPTMVLFLGFPPHIAGATSMFMIFLSSIVGGGTHAWIDDVLWGKVLWLAPGAFLGGRLGSWIAPRVSSKWLIRILGVFMILVALQLIIRYTGQRSA